MHVLFSDAILVEQRELWAAVAAIIRTWQSAWKLARQEMDKSVQVGLFGELLASTPNLDDSLFWPSRCRSVERTRIRAS
jgi:hypothetical protein